MPNGIAQATLGVSYALNGTFPFFTPPGSLESQDVVGVPQFGFRIGAGGWVEIQASYETIYLHERDVDGQTNTQFGSGDACLFTKVRLLKEGDILPALGLRFGTKLPNASRAEHLGTDETDWMGEILASRRFGPVTGHVNLGLALLGVPKPFPGQTFEAGGQDDLFAYSIAVVSKPLGDDRPEATHVTILGEVAGLAGSHFDNDRAAIRIGLQIVHGAATVYVGVGTGLITESEEFGANAGFTYTFDVAKLFSREADEP